MLTLRIDEQDARDLAFALRVAIDSGHLVDTYARVVELRGRIMSLVYDQGEQHAAELGWDANEGWTWTRPATSTWVEAS